MKTYFSIVLMFMLSTASIATPVFELNTLGKSIIINSTEWSAPGYTIHIKDIYGQQVFNKEYFKPSKGSTLNLNVDQLPAGEYVMELSNDFKIQTQTFTKVAGTLSMKDDVKTIFKPIVMVKGAIINVNFLNLDQSSAIEILDASNQVIYSSEINQLQYSKQFNLSSASSGEYSVHITQGERSYWTTVYIQ